MKGATKPKGSKTDEIKLRTVSYVTDAWRSQLTPRLATRESIPWFHFSPNWWELKFSTRDVLHFCSYTNWSWRVLNVNNKLGKTDSPQFQEDHQILASSHCVIVFFEWTRVTILVEAESTAINATGKHSWLSMAVCWSANFAHVGETRAPKICRVYWKEFTSDVASLHHKKCKEGSSRGGTK